MNSLAAVTPLLSVAAVVGTLISRQVVDFYFEVTKAYDAYSQHANKPTENRGEGYDRKTVEYRESKAALSKAMSGIWVVASLQWAVALVLLLTSVWMSCSMTNYRVPLLISATGLLIAVIVVPLGLLISATQCVRRGWPETDGKTTKTS